MCLFPRQEGGYISNSPVLLFDGTVKPHDNAVCVFDMYLSNNDLQQCADS